MTGSESTGLPESPALGFTHLQFEALLTAATPPQVGGPRSGRVNGLNHTPGRIIARSSTVQPPAKHVGRLAQEQ